MWFLVACFDMDLYVELITGVSNITDDQLPRNYVHAILFLLSSPGITAANTTPTIFPADSVLTRTGRDFTSLQHAVQRYYHLGSAQNTWRSYSSGIKRIKVCNLANKLALPTTESKLFLFATNLASLNLSHPTIKVHLAGVGSLYIAHSHYSTFNQQLNPRLQQVLKGIINS